MSLGEVEVRVLARNLACRRVISIQKISVPEYFKFHPDRISYQKCGEIAELLDQIRR